MSKTPSFERIRWMLCMNHPYIKYLAFINKCADVSLQSNSSVLFGDTAKSNKWQTYHIEYAVDISIHRNRNSYQIIFACLHITREYKRKLIIKLQYALCFSSIVASSSGFHSCRLRLTRSRKVLQYESTVVAEYNNGYVYHPYIHWYPDKLYRLNCLKWVLCSWATTISHLI